MTLQDILFIVTTIIRIFITIYIIYKVYFGLIEYRVYYINLLYTLIVLNINFDLIVMFLIFLTKYPLILLNYIFVLTYTIDNVHVLYISFFIGYTLIGVFASFFVGYIGTRGLFYIAEFYLTSIITLTITLLYYTLKYGVVLHLNLGSIFITQDIQIVFLFNFGLVNLLGITVVVILTFLVLTFGIEYMTREAFAYQVITNLILFSASIICFIVTDSIAVLFIFWELSGIISLLLIDTYYSRIRTTQAVSRTYGLNRLGDVFIIILLVETLLLCKTDSISTLITILPYCSGISSTLLIYIGDFSVSNIIVLAIFGAALCKSAQFLLFVWLPDAMEAPTPASALIHSSTLVVMGIFLIFKFTPILYTSPSILCFMVLVGSTSILYGSIYANLTGDLKKAVAYSTISQIGYLFTGCALLLFKQVLFYLIVHAICKALLFIYVGYIVHMFGGTTSLRKMGGIFFIIPDVAINMFIVCLILMGAPYTVGYFAKELLIYGVFNYCGGFRYYVYFCWLIALICTPFYLYRICILPIFGRPRTTRLRYRNIAPLFANYNFIDDDGKRVDDKTFLLKFTNYIQKWALQGRFTALLHLFFIIIILFCGEFVFYIITGYFGGSSKILQNPAEDLSIFLPTTYYITSYYTMRNVQLFGLMFFALSTLYYLVVNNQSTFNIIFQSIIVPIILGILIYILNDAVLQLLLILFN